MRDNDKQTSAQKKLISFLRKRDSHLNETDILQLLSGIKRFVNVVQKIYTEPQATITIKDKKEGNKTVHQRIISADLEEFKKVFDKNKTEQEAFTVMRKFHKSVTKDKYDR